MAKTWRDIFGIDEEIRDAVDSAVSIAVDNARADEHDRTTRTIYYSLVQDGDMLLERAAQRANMSIDDFSNAMRNAGYTVPQETVLV